MPPYAREAEEYATILSSRLGSGRYHPSDVRKRRVVPKDQLKLIATVSPLATVARWSAGTDDVADGLERLCRTGFSGTTLSFTDYVAEFPTSRDEVLHAGPRPARTIPPV